MMPKEDKNHDWEDFGAPTSPMVPITSPKKTTSTTGTPTKIRSRSSEKVSHRRREEKSDDKKKGRQSKGKRETTNEKKKALKEKEKSNNSNIKSSRRTSQESQNNTKDLENSFSTSYSDQGRIAETLMPPGVSQENITFKIVDPDEAAIRNPAVTTSRHSERGKRAISRPSPEGKSSVSRKIKLRREKSNEDLPFSSFSPSTSALKYQQSNYSERHKSSTGASVASEETAGFRVTQTSGNISLWEMRQKFKRDFPSEPIPSDVVLRQIYKSDKLAVYDLRERYKKERPGWPMLSDDDLQQLYQKPKEATVGVERAQSLERPPPFAALQRGESVATFTTEAAWEGYGNSVKKQEDSEMEEEDLQLEPKEWQEDLHASLELLAVSADHIPTKMKRPDDRSDWAIGHGLSKNETHVPTDHAAWDKRFRDSKATGTARDKGVDGCLYVAKPKSFIDLLGIPSDHFPSAKEDVAFGMSFDDEPPSSDLSTRETLTRSSIDLLLETESDHHPRGKFAKSSIDLLATESNHPLAETFGRPSIELLEDPSDHLVERFSDKTSAKETSSDISFQEATIELMEIVSKRVRKEEATMKATTWGKDFHESINSIDFLAEISASDDKNEGSWLDFGEGSDHNLSRRSNDWSQHRKSSKQRSSSYSDLKTSSKSSERSQPISRRTVEGDTLGEDEPLNVNKRGEKSQRRSRRSVVPDCENEKISTRASERSQRKSRGSVSLDTLKKDESDLANEMSQWKELGLFEEEALSTPIGVVRSKSEPLGNMRSWPSVVIRKRSDRRGDDNREGFETFETTEEGLQSMLRLNPSKLDASSSSHRRSASRDRIREKLAKKRKEEMEKKSPCNRRKIKFVPSAKTRRSEDTAAVIARSNPTKSTTAKRPTKAVNTSMAIAGTWMSDVPSMLIQRPEVLVGRSETVSPLTAASKKGAMISRRRFLSTPNL
jgi:hypothetical protein